MSGLTDIEFDKHQNDKIKPFECDHCVYAKISKGNNSIFLSLPFPVEYEGNIFGEPEKKLAQIFLIWFLNSWKEITNNVT